MSFSIDVRSDIKELTRHLNRVQKKAIPRATVRALNETATAHRTTALKQVAKDLRIPQKNVTARFDKHGKKKGERATIQKATRFNLAATIRVHVRGIPLIQIVTAAQKRRAAIKARRGGIRAAGGRRYARAFIAEAPGGNVQVFTRLGRSRYPIGVPKIGIRKRINAAYDKSLARTGASTFRKRFDRLLARELARKR